MFGNAFSGWHLLILLAVILLLFGAAKLPALAKSMGQSARLFKSEMKQMEREGRANPAAAVPTVDPVVSDGETAAARPVEQSPASA